MRVDISELFTRYASKDMDKRQFEELLFKTLIKGYEQYFPFRWGRAEFTDYLCWLYPRISRAIDKHHAGPSFEAYLRMVLRSSIREFHFSRKYYRPQDCMILTGLMETIAKEETGGGEPKLPAWMPEPYTSGQAYSAMEVKEDVPRYGAGREKLPSPKQILILILKSYYFASEDMLSRIAPLTGLGKEKVRDLIETLRKQRLRRDDEINGLRERISGQFFRCMAYERKLRYLTETHAQYVRIKTKLQSARARLKAMRERLAHMRKEATNLQVANLIGVPKGTIDSSIFNMKKRLLVKKDAGDQDPVYLN
jgi:hypothetical protein